MYTVGKSSDELLVLAMCRTQCISFMRAKFAGVWPFDCLFLLPDSERCAGNEVAMDKLCNGNPTCETSH